MRRLLAVNPRNRPTSAYQADLADGGVRDIHRQLALADFAESDFQRNLERYISLRIESDARLDGVKRYGG